jgi:hypothetical protein
MLAWTRTPGGNYTVRIGPRVYTIRQSRSLGWVIGRDGCDLWSTRLLRDAKEWAFGLARRDAFPTEQTAEAT